MSSNMSFYDFKVLLKLQLFVIREKIVYSLIKTKRMQIFNLTENFRVNIDNDVAKSLFGLPFQLGF